MRESESRNQRSWKVTDFAITGVPMDVKSVLERARDMLCIGREWIDHSPEERDNWKGHADLVEQQITHCLTTLPSETALTKEMIDAGAQILLQRFGGLGAFLVPGHYEEDIAKEIYDAMIAANRHRASD